MLQVRGCRSTEGTPEREFTLGVKPGMQEAARARRCLFMGGGAGELDPVAAAVRLQCAVARAWSGGAAGGWAGAAEAAAGGV